MKPNLKTAPKVHYLDVIKMIAKENHISEASVRTSIEGLYNVVVRELANGKTVELKGFGIFYTSQQHVIANWLTEKRPDRKRTTINPKFRPAVRFKQQIQALTGYPISNNHKPSEMIKAIKSNPVTHLQLDKFKKD